MRVFTMVMLALLASAACAKKEKTPHHGPDVADDGGEVDSGFTTDEPFGDPEPVGPVQAGQSLMLTDDAIVGSDQARGTGAWTFGKLMASMVSENPSRKDVSTFVKNWLLGWEKSRPGVREEIICPWLNASNFQDDCADGELDMGMAPFKLIAIVNRIDLHDPEHCEDAGELRFVFALIGDRRNERPLTVNFEYAVPTHEMPVRDWAFQWANASSFACGEDDCEDYRATVESITMMVTNLKSTAELEVFDEEDEGGEVMPNLRKQSIASLTSNLRHLRIHDKALGENQFRQYVWQQNATNGSAELALETETVSCQSCHAGDRFNLDPTAKAEARMYPAIADMMQDRISRLDELRSSTCQAQGGDGRRSVPW